MAKIKAKRTLARTEEQTQSNTYILMGGVAVVGLVLLGLLLFFNLRTPEPIRGLTQYPSPSRGHVNAVLPHTELPPPGGEHSPAWQNCGVYESPVAIENAIHSMEHGAIWITYRPDLPEADVERLQDIAWGENFLLLTPYENLASPVVLTAWGVQLELEDAGDGRIGSFINEYIGRGPEPGASCSNGVGRPIDR
jgi:hypothetical protein